jgi:hypothetical protein
MNFYLFTFLWLVLVWCRAAFCRALFGKRAAPHGLDQQLRIQAGLDGELSVREAQRMAEVLGGDPAAGPLLAELGIVKSALAGNEPERQVLQSRDFYWSQIAQAIAREAEVERRRRERISKWIWRFAPASGFALCLLILPMIARDEHPFHHNEVEAVLASVGTLNYRDPQAGLTVVWHYERSSGENGSSLAGLEESGGGNVP